MWFYGARWKIAPRGTDLGVQGWAKTPAKRGESQRENESRAAVLVIASSESPMWGYKAFLQVLRLYDRPRSAAILLFSL
jgi:hypothetical protein